MKPVFQKSRTTFEKIIIILMFAFLIAAVIGCNVNLDILIYAGLGTYIIIGLVAFLKPGILFEVLKKEDEEYLSRNQKKIPLLKAGFRYCGFTMAVMSIAQIYVFVVHY